MDTRRNQRLARTPAARPPARRVSRHESTSINMTADEQEDVLHEEHQALRDQLLHRVDIGCHAGDDPAGLLGLEVVERERHHVREQAVAHGAQKALADARDVDDREPAEQETRDGEAEIHDDREVQGTGITLTDAVVDAVLHQERSGRQGGGLQQEHERRAHDRDPLRLQHREQALEDPSASATQRLLGNASLQKPPIRASTGSVSSAQVGWRCLHPCFSTSAQNFAVPADASSPLVGSAITLPPSINTTRSARAIVACRGR